MGEEWGWLLSPRKTPGDRNAFSLQVSQILSTLQRWNTWWMTMRDMASGAWSFLWLVTDQGAWMPNAGAGILVGPSSYSLWCLNSELQMSPLTLNAWRTLRLCGGAACGWGRDFLTKWAVPWLFTTEYSALFSGASVNGWEADEPRVWFTGALSIFLCFGVVSLHSPAGCFSHVNQKKHRDFYQLSSQMLTVITALGT